MGGLREHALPRYRMFPDLDHALEWCERQLLEDSRETHNGHERHLADQLNDPLFDRARQNRKAQLMLLLLQSLPT